MLDTKSAYDIFIIVVKILFLLQIIIFTIREAALLCEMGFKYFLRFWNWITFILLLVCGTTFISFKFIMEKIAVSAVASKIIWSRCGT